jgi:hypothetical protein
MRFISKYPALQRKRTISKMSPTPHPDGAFSDVLSVWRLKEGRRSVDNSTMASPAIFNLFFSRPPGLLKGKPLKKPSNKFERG